MVGITDQESSRKVLWERLRSGATPGRRRYLNIK
jgi:hypothetical protein